MRCLTCELLESSCSASLSVKGVRRAGDAATGRIAENMGVDHGGLHILVAEEFLDGADVVAGHEEMGRETVAEGVRAHLLCNLCFPCGVSDGALNHRFVEVVAANDAGARIGPAAGGRKDVLPFPVAVGVGIFAGQGVR